MDLTESLISTKVFRLWGIVIVLTILGRLSATIFTHIFAAIVEAIKTGEEDPKIEDIEDERDKLIDLRGTKIAYIVSSIGVFLSMLAFVFGQPPLVMFSLLIFFGLRTDHWRYFKIGSLSKGVLRWVKAR